MGKQQILLLKLGGWKKRKKPPEKINTDVLWMLFMWVIMTAIISISSVSGTGWEEGDDSVNVISVENMDALLRLRMVTEYNTLEAFLNITENERRSKREVQTDLCSRKEQCSCIDIDKGKGESVNVTCNFRSSEVIDLGPGSLPSNIMELHIVNAKELKILPGAFSDHQRLSHASFRKTENLLINNQAFLNLTKSHFILEIKDCQTLILEEHSFRNLRSPLSATIENCNQVIMKKSIFSWLLGLEIKNVPNLSVAENAFHVEINKAPGYTATTITFRNVTVNKVPNATFPLNAAKIRFEDCTIESISSDAFKGLSLDSVSFERTTLTRLESGAFSDRTLLKKVEFSNCIIQNISSGVLRAVNNLTIENSTIDEILGGAFKVNTASMKLSKNIFKKIRHHAFEINQWNRIIIEENRFEKLEPESFLTPFSNITNVRNEFRFLNNILLKTEVDILSFIPNAPELDVKVEGNKFKEPCHCHLEGWVRERSPNQGDIFYETSYCLVSDLLSRCYNLEKGYMRMINYSRDICGSNNQVICEESIRSYRPAILTDLDLENTEKTVLSVIFLGVICSVGIMLLVLSVMWMKEKEACGRMRKYLSPFSFFGMFSRWFNTSSLVTTASISRINIHEYAEIQNQLNTQQKQTIIPIEEEEEELIIYEDKATQTLPEELTQELLQSLREKLDDPENYNEARDMIEHLYDLIKVEESCNNNHASPRTSFLFDEEEEEQTQQDGGNIYDVIPPRRQPTRKNSKPKRKNLNATSIGTRAPSPDKLLPINFNVNKPAPTIINEYCQPRDRKSNEYCELPGAEAIMPDIITGKPFNCLKSISKHVYAEPITSNMLNRPLPNKPDQPGTSYS